MVRWYGHPSGDWRAVALWLIGLDVALFALSRAIDLLRFPRTTYGFLAATLAYAVLVWYDAYGAGLRRAWLWAVAVTFVPLAGARERRAR
jgi:hypothetical protein